LSKKSPYLIERILRPIEQFARVESASGIVLLAMTIVALIIANSIISDDYLHLLETPLSISVGSSALTHSLADWVSDGLMAVFFFLVGLEIKREFISGELSTIKHASLPIFGALGGMIVPAAIFAFFNSGTANSAGWGIPMATDIAFALGVVTMLGKRVPVSLKVFLVALAIIDDIGAVIVIAIFYTRDIHFDSLITGLSLLGILLGGNAFGVRSRLFYALIGIAVWYAFLQSGVHATVAGVLVAFTVPTKHRINAKEFYEKCVRLLDSFILKSDKESILAHEEAKAIVRKIETNCEHVQTPLSRFEQLLGTFVAFVIMPIFVLANAGVRLEGDVASVFSGDLGLGIILGLVLGKPIGIFLFAFLSSKIGLTKLPENTSWLQLLAVGLLGGIGFTMSLFITGLAFTGSGQIADAKLAILVGSVCASLLGWLAFSWISRGGVSK
jgi:Na+:H+ antiporter, NhaA family